MLKLVIMRNTIKNYHYLIFAFLLLLTSCNSKNHAKKQSKTKENTPAINKEKKKVAKVIFYLENSGSMFGYVRGSGYVDVISELSSKPKFIEAETNREFYFVNGGKNVRLTKVGNYANLKEKLNIKGFRCGDFSKSNLNSMIQLALNKAQKDTITILVSDAIYDLGNKQAPQNALVTESKDTRSKFIKRLSKGNLETIIIKIDSYFKGNYFPVTGGSIGLSQKRPFYIWAFGKTALLNDYFSEEYIKSLGGYLNSVRFLNMKDSPVPFQITANYDKAGSFRFDREKENELLDVESDRHGQGFKFSLAVDLSSLPFSDSYLTTASNYTCDNSNYSIDKIDKIGDMKLYDVGFKPTHIIVVSTNKNPLGKLSIALKSIVPKWIENTNVNNEIHIKGDTLHTFGFKSLTDGISEAYQYKNKESNIVTFKVELTK